jgi:RNA polymerase sigma factor (sigma-70 family)
MSEHWEDQFEGLLAWLDPDREKAGKKYEEIRQSLINIFSWRGCHDAEDLADEAITRVTNKVGEVAKDYSGDPALYFYGVAKKMIWEIVRRQRTPTVPVEDLKEVVAADESVQFEDSYYDCLEHCLAQLSAAERELILRYYQQEKPKIRYRRELARRLGMAPNNLRVKVHRIRAVLHSCLQRCLREKSENETK